MTYIKPAQTIRINDSIVDFNRPLLMGILNITPDSFFDGGTYNSIETSLHRVKNMINEGVDIIDIGAYSSRPGATEISAQEEIDRLLPVLEKIKEEYPNLNLSIDTFRASVAEEALTSGAHIINDISGGQLDPDMFDLVAKYNVPYVMMHMRSTPMDMQKHTHYEDLVEDIAIYFGERINQLRNKGVKDIILDPGFGFSKTLEQNYELLYRIEELHYFGLPLLAGISRKSMIYKKLQVQPEDALVGTIALNTLLLSKGVQIIRVHDIKEAKQVINLLS